MSASAPSVINVAQVAHLARLDLTPAEQAAFQQELAAVVGYVRKLQEVNVDGVEPTAHATQLLDVTRADDPGTCQDRAATLANAPAVAGDELFRVPTVIADGGEGAA